MSTTGASVRAFTASERSKPAILARATQYILHGRQQDQKGPALIDQGELYWIHPEAAPTLAPTRAHPHVVVQEDVLNHSRIETVVVCALSSNLRRANEPGNVLLDEGEGGLPKRSVVVVSQISSVDKRCLGERIGNLSSARVTQILDGLRFQQRAFFRGTHE